MLTSSLSANYDDIGLFDDHVNICPAQRFPSVLRHHRYSPQDPMMTRHLKAACRFGTIIERVAVRYGLLPSIIAGFGSRQSGWGLDLSPAGSGGAADFAPRPHRTADRQAPLPSDGNGFARGLMLLDYDRYAIARGQEWRDPEANLEAACQAVADHRSCLRKRTTLQGFGLLRAAFAAFECGLERVQQAARLGLDVDSPTSGQDYGRDILDRAGFFQAHGWD